MVHKLDPQEFRKGSLFGKLEASIQQLLNELVNNLLVGCGDAAVIDILH